ncbi:MAG: L-threonylcarbamoyladenylate synthase [Myxococcota bacterium]
METELLSATPAAIAKAAGILERGGLVAFPTETVYGLGANAEDASAVREIYAAKGRPSNNPVIVHVLNADAARRMTTRFDAEAERLAQAFWPGPLTLVLPRGPSIPAIVAAGGDTVALRAPRHPVGEALLAAFGGPIAAPSANRSLAVSPTTAEDVLEELGGRIDLILDGGPTEVGLESTVLDLCADPPRILRPGMVLKSQIEAALGRPIELGGTPDAGVLRSPGQLSRHYAPRRPLLLKPRQALAEAPPDVGILSVGPFLHPTVWALEPSPEGYARELYAALRSADRAAVREIWVEIPPSGEAWTAVHDRLRRAASTAIG